MDATTASEKINAKEQIVNPYETLSKKTNIIGYSYTTLMGAHNRCSFKVSLKVNKKRYVAIGPSIRAAKNMASLAALQEMYKDANESPSKVIEENNNKCSDKDSVKIKDSEVEEKLESVCSKDNDDSNSKIRTPSAINKDQEFQLNGISKIHPTTKIKTVLNPFSKKKNINKNIDHSTVSTNSQEEDDDQVPEPPKLCPDIGKRKSKDILINPVRKKLKLSVEDKNTENISLSQEFSDGLNLSREETINHCLSILLHDNDDDAMSSGSDDVEIIENDPPEIIDIEQLSTNSDEICVLENTSVDPKSDKNSKVHNKNNININLEKPKDENTGINKSNDGLNHSKKCKQNPIEMKDNVLEDIKNSTIKMLPKIKIKTPIKSRPHTLNRQKHLQKWALKRKNNKKANKYWNPIKNLKALCPEVIYKSESEIGQSHAPFFIQSATLNGRNFIGHGKTKNLARIDVAKQILDTMEDTSKVEVLKDQKNEEHSGTATVRSKKSKKRKRKSNFNLNNFAGQSFQELSIENFLNNLEDPTNLINNIRQNYVNNCPSQNQAPFQFGKCNQRSSFRFGFPTFDQKLYLPQHQADVIEKLVLQRFEQVIANRSEARNYKVLAGIVMTHHMDFQNGKVIAIATGTKCINGGNICSDGSVVNDSHAEVIARRCLLKYFYNQLKQHCNSLGAKNSIFLRNPSGLQYQFTLNSNVQFHLYISTAPCGDARVFSSSDNYFSNDHNYGQLRTKVEGGMGTQRVRNQYLYQAWDGIQIGEPLHTMSCSDKIARWNVLGVQGALLATLVEPIYFSSIVLGSMFNTQHLYRAVCGRLENNISYLPKPFHLNRPLLGQTSKNQLRRNTEQIPCIGMNWTLGDNGIELISLPAGRQISNKPSHLCKKIFFQKFIDLIQKLPNLDTSRMPNIYADVKLMARDFQLAKQELFNAFQHARLGCWIKKPQEQNEFAESIRLDSKRFLF